MHKKFMLSHWRPLFLRAVTQLAKRLALVPALALWVRPWLAVIPSQARLLVVLQGMPAILALFVTNTPSSALGRSCENLIGMPPVRGVPFCLPKA